MWLLPCVRWAGASSSKIRISMHLTLNSLSPRFSAMFLHFVFSLFAFTILVGILLYFWYPQSYFSASGGWQGLRIVALVDVVLGPLLTLIVYDQRKSRRELLLDIGVVVLIQLGALGLGVRAVYEQRPVAVVFLDNSFYTVPAADIMHQGIDLGALARFGEKRPVYVYAQRPDSGDDLARFNREVNENQIPPHEQVWLYQPLSENFASVIGSSIDIEEVIKANSKMKARIEHLLDKTGSRLEDYYYLALTSRYRNVVLVFDKQGRLQGTINAPYKTGKV